jgi:dihydrofolate synthase/folylpolyglutamate synthase
MIGWLYGLQHFGVKLGLDNIRTLLDLLGRPERAYASAIVGGTNGKGSVAAMLHAMLETAGVRAGLYTSPHLVRPNERIRIGASDVGDEELSRRLAEMRQRIEAGLAGGTLEAHPSFFEVLTAVALEAFAAHALRAAVLEVGLGGRLDATNAVEADVAVIVGVDLDHTKTLGDTVAQIAAEKAGIVKPGRPVVSGIVRQRAIDVLERTCRERGSPLVDARTAVRLVAERGDRIDLASCTRRYDDLHLALEGRHQIDNARVAIAAFEALAPRLGVEPSPAAVREALSSVRWPGRLHWVRHAPLEADLLLDGAHNPAGMCALASYLARRRAPRPVAVFGVMNDKLVPEMLALLAPWVEATVITRPAVERAADPDLVATQARAAGMARVETIDCPSRALAHACGLARGGSFILVTGSLYLVGQILGFLEGRLAPGPVSM